MSPVTPSKTRLRELASLRPEGHKVLSLYLNLDPSEFPTPKARKTELESLLDVVERAVRDDGLSHDQKVELKQDVERIRTWFTSEFDASGTRGAAVFAASAIDLFEVHRLGRPIRSEVTIDDSPFIEPLAGMPGVRRLQRVADQPPARAHPGRRFRRHARGDQLRRRRAPLARPGRLVAGALPARHPEGDQGPRQARGRRAVQALQARSRAAADHRLSRRDARARSSTPCTATCASASRGTSTST